MMSRKHALILLLNIILFTFSTFVSADTWFVRPTSANNYGLGDGTSYENAWNGFSEINWSILGGGDTLYVSGVFDKDLIVESGGSLEQDLVIRGDYSTKKGSLVNADILWKTNNNNYIKIYGIQIMEGGILFANAITKYNAYNIQFISPKMVRDFYKQFIARGFVPGMMISTSGGPATNRMSYKIESVSDKGEYEEITIDLTEGVYSFSDEGPGFKGFDVYWPNHNITIDNCSISRSSYLDLIEIKGTNFSIQNCDLNGGAIDRAGVIYVSNRYLYKRHENILIENNYIHDSGSTATSQRDEHCIGIQGVDGIKITKNHLKNCAAGIVFYHTINKPLTNWEVTYNYIESMDYNLNNRQWGGSGIIFSGEDDGPNNTPGVVAHNIIVNPINCPHSLDIAVACRGIRSKFIKTTYLHNNLIDGYDYGIELKGAFSANLKNNVILNSNIYHMDLEASYTSHEEDYNVYFPDTGNFFMFNGRPLNFKEYNEYLSQVGVIVNAHSIIADPDLDNEYKPVNGNEPIINTGVNMGYDYLQSVTWPIGPGGGKYIFKADDVLPEIGPFVLSVNPPSPPTLLQ